MSAVQAAETSVSSLTKDIKIIDVDTHFTEPLDLWTSRAPAKYKDRVPQMKMTDGEWVWTIDGRWSMGVGHASSVVHKDGHKAEGMTFTDWQNEDVHPGCYQIKDRLKLMDEQGVHAQIVYPNVMGFAGQGRGKASSAPLDDDLKLLCTQIYNDAMGEAQAESAGRLLPMALLPWWDIKLALAEAERCHAMGMRGININSDPHKHGMQELNGEYWEPLWEFCVDKNLPVNFHIGASDSSMSWYGDAPWPSFSRAEKLAVGSTMMFLSNARVICNLILSGLLDRYPTLKFVSVESGVGWLPFILEALEYQIAEGGCRKYDLTPLEYFRRQLYGTFWFENRDIVDTIRKLGVDNVMFETDFPHPTCLYPEPINQISEGLAALTAEERRKILSENAAKVYNIPL